MKSLTPMTTPTLIFCLLIIAFLGSFAAAAAANAKVLDQQVDDVHGAGVWLLVVVRDALRVFGFELRDLLVARVARRADDVVQQRRDAVARERAHRRAELVVEQRGLREQLGRALLVRELGAVDLDDAADDAQRARHKELQALLGQVQKMEDNL